MAELKRKVINKTPAKKRVVKKPEDKEPDKPDKTKEGAKKGDYHLLKILKE